MNIKPPIIATQSHALEAAAAMLRAIAKGESFSSGDYWNALLQIEAVAGIEKLSRVQMYLASSHDNWSQEYQDKVNVLNEANNQLVRSFESLQAVA